MKKIWKIFVGVIFLAVCSGCGIKKEQKKTIAGPAGPRRRHPYDPGYPASQRGCGDRSDQGQLPVPHFVPGHVAA